MGIRSTHMQRKGQAGKEGTRNADRAEELNS